MCTINFSSRTLFHSHRASLVSVLGLIIAIPVSLTASFRADEPPANIFQALRRAFAFRLIA